MTTLGRTRNWIFLTPVLLFSAAGAALGFWKAISYDAKPGQPAVAAGHWPGSCGLAPEPGRATLVMMVHPGCPCSRASLSELSQLMTHYPEGVKSYVLFERPAGFTDAWEQTDLWKDADIDGVSRVKDENHVGMLAFGAKTSGQVLLYDASGVLRFSGGITGSRGHEGDNDGLAAIETFLRTGRISLEQTPVYGCAL